MAGVVDSWLLRADSAQYSSLLYILRGIRNGAYYGTKIRLPHAFVMTFLFRPGKLRDKIRAVLMLTYEHTKNLAMFVGTYKASLEALRLFQSAITGSFAKSNGRPAAPWHALVAGGVGGYLVWSKYSSVNYQIVMYLLSRIIIAQFRKLSADGLSPFSSMNFSKVYPALATLTWAVVMFQFENYGSLLHPSLRSSMDFLYHDSNLWKEGLKDFLPSPATALVVLAVLYGL